MDPGKLLQKYVGGNTLEDCKKKCDQLDGCESFGYCPNQEGGSCWMRDKSVCMKCEQKERTDDCFTVYKVSLAACPEGN